MTELMAQTDAYARSCSAAVVAVTAEGVALDRTVFYPGGGGQPADHGLLIRSGLEIPVEGIVRTGAIVHRVPPEGFAVGDPVEVRIDWDRRYRLMRTHTALHILCGVIWRDHRAQVTGGNMEPCRGRLDFEFETLGRELVEEIEHAVNREVQAQRPIKVAVLPRAEAFAIPDLIRTKVNLLPEGIREVRTVEIEGLDLQADGGTHVANTGEVGPIRIANYKSKGRINKRIVIELQGSTGVPEPTPT